MNKKIFQLVFVLLALSIIGSVFLNYLKFNPSELQNTHHLINESPAHEISRTGNLKFIFKQELTIPDLKNKLLNSSDYIKLNPKTEGSFYMPNNKTLEFIPYEPLKPNTSYKGKLNLHRLFKTGKSKEVFKFRFNTPKLKADFFANPHYYIDSSMVNQTSIRGEIVTSDYIELNTLKSKIQATQDQRVLPISIVYGRNQSHYRFTISQIARLQSNSLIKLFVKAEKDDYITGDTLYIDMVGKNNFELIAHEVSEKPTRKISLVFSDIIKANQNLESIIVSQGFKVKKITENLNVVDIYLKENSPVNGTITISNDLLNRHNNNLIDTTVLQLNLGTQKPHLNFIDQGNNIDIDHPLSINIEAQQIDSIQFKIIHIAHDNTLQFLQVNAIDQFHEINRVGNNSHTYYKKLSNQAGWNPNKKQAYHISLRAYSLPENGILHISMSGQNGITASKNFVLSKYKLIAKKDGNNTISVFAHDMATGQALKGVKINTYTFQQKHLATYETNSLGHVAFPLSPKAPFVVAQDKKDFNYLRLSDYYDINDTIFPLSAHLQPYFINGDQDSLIVDVLLENKLHPNTALKISILDASFELYSQMIFQHNGKKQLKLSIPIPNGMKPGMYTLRMQASSQLIDKQFWYKNNNKKVLSIDFKSNLKNCFNKSKPVKIRLKTAAGLPLKHTKFKAELKPLFNTSPLNTQLNKATIFYGKTNKYGDASFYFKGNDKNVNQIKLALINFTALGNLNSSFSLDTLVQFSPTDKNPFAASINNDRLILKLKDKKEIKKSIHIEVYQIKYKRLIKKIDKQIIANSGTSIVDLKKWELLNGNYLIYAYIPNSKNKVYLKYERHIPETNSNYISFPEDLYLVNDTLNIRLNNSNNLNTLLTIENFKGLHFSFFEPMVSDTLLSIPLTKEMAPTVQINYLSTNIRGNECTQALNLNITKQFDTISPIVEELDLGKYAAKREIAIWEKNGEALNYSLAVISNEDVKNYTSNLAELFQTDPYYYPSNYLIANSGYSSKVLGQLLAENTYNCIYYAGVNKLNENDTNFHVLPEYINNSKYQLLVNATSTQNSGATQIIVPLHRKKDFSVKLETPKQVAPNDYLPVTIWIENNLDKRLAVEVSVSEPRNLNIHSELNSHISLKPKEQKSTQVWIKVKPQINDASFNINLNSDKHNHFQTIDLNVRKLQSVELKQRKKNLQANEYWRFSFEPYNLSNSNLAFLEYSDTIPFSLTKLYYNALLFDELPLEQRIEIAFPLLYIKRLLASNSLDNAFIDNYIDQTIRQINRSIYKVLNTEYKTFTDPGLIYVLHFLSIANNRGYDIDLALYNKLNLLLQSFIYDETHTNKELYNKAYLLYVLSLNGSIKQEQLHPISYIMEGNEKVQSIIASAYSMHEANEKTLDILEHLNKPKEAFSASFLLNTWSSIGDHTHQSDLLDLIVTKRNLLSPLGSLEKLLTIINLLEYYWNIEHNYTTDVQYTINNGKQRIESNNQVVNTIYIPVEFSLGQSITVKNQNNRNLYFTFNNIGTPLTPKALKSNKIKLKAHYLLPNGIAIEPQNVSVNTPFVLEVVVSNLSNNPFNGFLSFTIPTGWAFYNQAMNNVFRESLMLKAKETKTYKLELYTKTRGAYFIPPIEIYDLFQSKVIVRSLQGNTKIN